MHRLLVYQKITDCNNQKIHLRLDEDVVEFFLYDYNFNIVFLDYNFTDYRVIDNILTINPEQDVLNYVGEDGLYYLTYNFLSNRLNSSVSDSYYIREISTDRTELRLDSNIISNLDSNPVEFQIDTLPF